MKPHFNYILFRTPPLYFTTEVKNYDKYDAHE